MTTEPSRRITWIDTLKGIGATLVILGHTVGFFMGSAICPANISGGEPFRGQFLEEPFPLV